MKKFLTCVFALVFGLMASSAFAQVEYGTDFLEIGLLQHRIAHRVSLEKIADAHELIEKAGFYGAVIVGLE